MSKILKLFISELIIFGLLSLESFVFMPLLPNFYVYYIKPLVWAVFAFCLYFLVFKKFTITKKYDKFTYIFVITIINIVIYYCLGLFIGFGYSPYDLSFVGILINTFAFLLILIPIEFIRISLVSNATKKWHMTSIIFIMMLFTISPKTLYSAITKGITISFIFQTLVPCFISQLFLNYIAKHCGVSCCLLWTMVPQAFKILTPILPKLDWFYSTLYAIIGPLICFVFLYYSYTEKQIVKDLRVGRRKKPYGMFFSFSILFVLLGLVTGMFGVKPTVIASNSMNDYFFRGDIVVVDYDSKYDIGSVIQYKHDNIKILHRIVKKDIDNSGKTYYITKGDNNNAEDSWKVYDDQIDGVVRFVIPKLGYISLFFNEMIGGA